MKMIKTEDAVGHVLCHDITQIIRGVTKDAVFRKGHIVREEDIPVLLSVGKEHLYVWENDDTVLHENDAAQVLFEMCRGDHMHGTDVKEGKIELISDIDGLFKIRRDALVAVNSIGEIMIACRHGDFPVKKGDKLAGTRIIPIMIAKEKMEKAKEAAGSEPILNVIPYRHKKAGIVTTGSEVFKGRIKDTFGPVIREKLKEFPTEVIGQIYTDDKKDDITKAIMKQIDAGADLVICTGGMSVDPDDCTPGAIADTGAQVITYGAPVLPGAMLMIAYYEKDGRRIPILGLPGCVMYARRTVFDLVLPRIMADDPIAGEDIFTMGEGGLCLNCETCIYPNCGFGK